MIDAIQPGDLPSLLRLYTDPRCRRYLGGPVDEDEAKGRIEQLLDPPASTHAWTIREQPTGAAVGLVILHPHHDGQDTELSYMLFPDYQGKGLATQAARFAIGYAFNTLCLPRLVSETQSANTPSIRLLERVGMTLGRRITRFGAEQSIYAIESDA